MKFLIALFLVGSSDVYASRSFDWFCTEESSIREDGSISSCGLGLGKTEDDARTTAFNNAEAEFNRICNSSDDCKNHNITTMPKRTTCSQVGDQYKCYRLVVFSIGKIRDTLSPAQAKANKYMPFGSYTYEEIAKEVNDKFDKDMNDLEKKMKQMSEFSN